MAGYGTDSGFAEWLASNGHHLPPTAPDPAVLRHRGSVYIDGLYGPKFAGVAADGFSQERAWPRVGAEAFGQVIPSNVIPVAVEHAAYAAAWHEANNDGALSPAASQAAVVKREKVDVLEVEYAVGSGDPVRDAQVRIAEVEGLLSPFLRQALPSIFVV